MWDDDEVILIGSYCDPLDVVLGTPLPVMRQIIREYQDYIAFDNRPGYVVPQTEVLDGRF